MDKVQNRGSELGMGKHAWHGQASEGPAFRAYTLPGGRPPAARVPCAPGQTHGTSPDPFSSRLEKEKISNPTHFLRLCNGAGDAEIWLKDIEASRPGSGGLFMGTTYPCTPLYGLITFADDGEDKRGLIREIIQTLRMRFHGAKCADCTEGCHISKARQGDVASGNDNEVQEVPGCEQQDREAESLWFQAQLLYREKRSQRHVDRVARFKKGLWKMWADVGAEGQASANLLMLQAATPNLAQSCEVT
eukprot:1160568-Pelagomonas_calceolata.AAC.5